MVLGIFYLSHKHKESKEYSHRKGRLKNSRSSSLTYFLSLFYGKKTKSQTITKARKGSQTGAGQGREGLDNTCAYACRVRGESTAVFPSPLYFPPIINSLTLVFLRWRIKRSNSGAQERYRPRLCLEASPRAQLLSQGAIIKRKGLRGGF